MLKSRNYFSVYQTWLYACVSMPNVTQLNIKGLGADKYTEPQKKRRTKKYNSQFFFHLNNEIVYMCNDKILVQR